MKSVILNASFAFFIALSSTAHANPGERTGTTPQVVVSYADLDLSREAGARVMLDRLNRAASKVCGGWPDLHILDQLVIYRACTRKALDNAVAQLGSARVSALYGSPVERLALRH